MKHLKESTFIEKNSSKYAKLFLIKESYKPDKLNKSNLSGKVSNNNMPFLTLSSLKNKGTNLNISKNLYLNNKIDFIPHFGKGFNKKIKTSFDANNYNLNEDNNNNLLIYNSSQNKSNININLNNNIDTSYENSDSEKNLKIVEKELKNRLLDMSFIMQENKSFIMDYKWKNSDIFSIEEEPINKKKKKKKNKNKNKIKKSKDIEKDRRIFKKLPLYDSLDEDEDLQENDDSFYINPEGNFIFILDIIILISSFYCFIYTPIQIAFNKSFCIEEGIFIKIILSCIDIIFIFDFLISFFRAFYNYEYKLIKDTKQIIKNYLYGSFYIEFLKALPFNLMIIYLCLFKETLRTDNFCFYNGKKNGLFISIKLLSGIKIINVLKVMNKKKK